MKQTEKLTLWHKAQLGTREEPANSNKTRYGALYGYNGVAWCCQYIWAGFYECGLSKLFYGGKKTASCTALMNWAKKAGRWVTSGYKEGDIILYNFNSNAASEHVGYCLKADEKWVTAIEGNTSPNDLGDQANGGCVAEKRRSLSCVLGAFRPEYEEQEMTQEMFNSMMKKYMEDLAKEAPSEWSAEARAWAEGKNIIRGDENGNKKYMAFLTREEMAQILFNLQK